MLQYKSILFYRVLKIYIKNLRLRKNNKAMMANKMRKRKQGDIDLKMRETSACNH